MYMDGRAGLREWAARSPGFCEAIQIRTYSYLAKVTGCPISVVHLSSFEGLEEVVRARDEGVKIVAETTPQYLWITVDDDPPGVWGKVTPPIRDKENAAKLLQGLSAGKISYMGTDHVPLSREQLVGGELMPPDDTEVIKGLGLIGMPTLLPSMLSEGVNKGRLTLSKVVEVCCRNPAYWSGLYPKKGAIMVGSDADLLLVDMKLTKKVTPETLHSPYASFFTDWELTGWPVLTMLKGNTVMEDGKVVGKPGAGAYLRRQLGAQTYPALL